MSESLSPELLEGKLSALGGTPTHRYVCAVSGGADSLSLAHALAQLQIAVRLVHVNHHLQSGCDQWAHALSVFARQHELPFTCLEVFPDGSGNVEARAREARYAALKENLQSGEILLTAHHQDDQALTLVLQLLRGAGVTGLAAMPEKSLCGAHPHWRPLLDISGVELRRYAQQQQLPVIEDPSNADERFARNYLRAQVVPALETRWPAFARTLSRSATHCAQADMLLGELARIDAPQLGINDGIDLSTAAVPTDSRAENVLRYALRVRGAQAPATARLQEFVRQVRFGARDSEPQLDLESLTLRSYERHVFLVDTFDRALHETTPLLPSQPLVLPSPSGTMLWHASEDSPDLSVRFRQGGERYGRSPSRSLKHFFQQRGVLPWYRSFMPLVYDGKRIVAIGDLWQDPGLTGIMVWYPQRHFLL